MTATRSFASAVTLLGTLALAGCQEHEFTLRHAPGEIDVPDDLYAVTGVGERLVWAVGYFGAIYRSQDGGDSWQKLDPGTERSLYDVSFADERNGWVVGQRGYVIHTTDGGDTWQPQQTPRQPARHLFSIDAIDASRAWIVGDWGTRFYTDDGGKTWQDRSFLISEEHPSFKYLTEEEIETFRRGEKVYDDVYLNDVFFVDADHGWVVAEYGTIYYTADAGESWAQGRIQGEVSFEPVPFEVEQDGLSDSVWPQVIAMAEVLQAKPYLRVRLEPFLTAAELAARGGDPTFADERARSLQDFLEGEGVSQDRIKIVNETPFDQEEVDMVEFARKKVAPAPHVRIEVVETPFLYDVKFDDPLRGYIAGLGGVILLSEDGGQSWRYAPSETSQGLFAIGRGARAMFAVGEKGVHRRSLDGGATWAAIEPDFQARYDFFGFMRDLAFPTPERGFVVGQAAAVFRSTDGGLHWEKIDVQRPRDASATGE
jgi:photosystem II stability/assembly factor-like uncharacterized protein